MHGVDTALLLEVEWCMDRVEAMQAFVAVAEEGGFAPAARRLSLSPPAVTRAVAALETRIGARLFVRTTRVVRLTEAGVRFLADARRILAELREAEAAAAGEYGEPRGLVAVTAPVMFGRMHVAPVIFAFLTLHPMMSVRTLFLDRVVDILEEGMDVAVRIAHLPDSSLAAVRVGSVRRIICAAPDYLARHGGPLTPADLAEHDAVAFAPITPHAEWAFDVDGRADAVAPRTRLFVNQVDVAIAAVVAGRGVTRVLSYQAEPEIRAGRLRRVLTAFEPPPVPIHIVHPEGRRASARVRAFVDFAVERLRAERGVN
jgi:DNA-binding transcriptional LysR family regulator